MSSIIQAHQLVKEFKTGNVTTQVLKGIDFDLNPGEFAAITGKSGSGKSTLLYQLGLLDRPTTGKITIEGVRIDHLSETERTEFRLKNFGYIFQNYALLPSLTALENVKIPLMMRNFSPLKAEKMAKDALEHVDLADRMHHLPYQLSGGQQQRVSIARAIAGNPKIIFADEPTANLDSVMSDLIVEIFLQIHKLGHTIVLVTHEDSFAQQAGKQFVLKDGLFVSDK